jgi:O-acetyl-ADP-ribose deacetylase
MDLQVILNDITTMKVDAIVNAANPSLLGGGGVDGEIHRAAGSQLLEVCKKHGGCKTGQAKITPGFSLPASFVIHTVGPIWSGGQQGESVLLASCYHSCLKLAEQHELKTLAFPAISCGVYGYPNEEAVKIAVNTVSKWTGDHPAQVFFVCFSERMHNLYQKRIAGS